MCIDLSDSLVDVYLRLVWFWTPGSTCCLRGSMLINLLGVAYVVIVIVIYRQHRKAIWKFYRFHFKKKASGIIWSSLGRVITWYILGLEFNPWSSISKFRPAILALGNRDRKIREMQSYLWLHREPEATLFLRSYIKTKTNNTIKTWLT